MFRITLAIHSLLQMLRCVLFPAGALLGLGRNALEADLPPRLGGTRTLRRLPVSKSGTNVWIHAATADDVEAAQPLIEALSRKPPRLCLWVSTSTASGREAAQSNPGDQATVFRHPIDLRTSCRRYLRHLRPRVILLVGDVFRPNLVVAAAEFSVPVILIDGRVPDRDFRRYRRLSFFVRPQLERISHFCVRSRRDRERLVLLGAPEVRVNWVGDLRLDSAAGRHGSASTADGIERLLPRGPDDIVLCCVGVEPEEESTLARMYLRLRSEFPRLKLLLACRRRGCAPEIASLLEREGASCAPGLPESFGVDPSAPVDALVLDSFESPLPERIYTTADLVFVGGSLIPGRGENPIAPAAFGKPILFGPHMRRFGSIRRTLVETYAALRVASPEELEARLTDLIADPQARLWLGRNARKAIRANEGSVDRTAAVVRRYLEA